MPLKPPEFIEPSRFDPIYLTDEDVDDLANFTGMSPDACRRRVQEYAAREFAEAWQQANPRGTDEILDFYRSTDLYLWELAQWHASDSRRRYWEALAHVADRYAASAGWRRVYEFGCGIGTDGLFLASRGYDVTLVDVDGPAFRLAQHRFAKRDLPATFIASQSALPEPDGCYDVIVCFDVFEHLPDPVEAARRLIGSLRVGGVLLQTATFEASDDQGFHLATGVHRFDGMKWHIGLSRLGMRHVAPLVYVKGSAIDQIGLRMRHALWSTTGLWIMRA